MKYSGIEVFIEQHRPFLWSIHITANLNGVLPVYFTSSKSTKRRAEKAASKMVAYLNGEGPQPGFIFP